MKNAHQFVFVAYYRSQTKVVIQANNKTHAVAIKVKTSRSESFIIREDLLHLLNSPISLIVSNAPDMHVIC
jgi:hypothetical protein